MIKLPLLISVPHAGLTAPPEVTDLCVLTPEQIAADGDEGAREIYAFESDVVAFVTSDVARAIVDLNRAENDFRADGVIKTHTCWNVPVYRNPPCADLIETLLARYHRPYHDQLRARAKPPVRIGVDCHTMAAVGPPIGPGAGEERPWVCLSHANFTCPQEWFVTLAACLERSFGVPIALNEPFQGGYIVRTHTARLPWVQLELSRAPFATFNEKRACVLRALRDWCADLTDA